MGFGKSLAKIVALTSIATTLALGVPKAESAEIRNPYFYGNVTSDFFAGTELANLITIPEYIRDVPIHPDDTYANPKNNAPIKNGKLTWNANGADVNGKIGIGFKEGKFDFRGGLNGGISGILISGRERNYTNFPGTSKKGVGAALTYYGIGMGLYSLGLNAEVLLNLNDNFDLFLEYFDNFIPTSLSLTDGWDRNSTIQIYKKYLLADVSFCNTFKVGGKFHMGGITYLRFFAGAKVLSMGNKTAMAEETGLTTKPISFFIGGGAEFDFYPEILNYLD
jgi:hypothetical protein